ncbi:MAG: D-isomer specific 2-hydroxyacid dehydrogenase family protein [Lacisediminihabitans sp.]
MLSTPVEQLPAERRPTPGPIAVLPNPKEIFVEAVRAGGGTVAELSSDTRGVIWLSSKEAQDLTRVLAENPQIEWVQLPWAGVDGFSAVFPQFVGRALPLWTSAKGAYSQPVAEHTLALTLALLREFPKRVVATSWAKVKDGTSLFGLTVLIIGAGGVAIELIRILEPFHVHVTVVRRSAGAMPGAEQTFTIDHLDELLPKADVVVVAAAFTEGTSKLIAAPQLAAMKPTAILVNIARGGLVDTDALTEALAKGTIAGAGLDVTDPEPLNDGHPLWNEPRVIITPHSADTPEMTAPLLAERIRINVEAFLGDGRFIGIVDPEAGY